MLIYLLRHGLTEYNAQKRYQGQRDIPLSPEGLAQLRRADIDPKVVYISTLQRTRQTAEVLFPDAELVPVDGLKEMCFGSFEGRNYIEMEHDPDYQAWVAANCESSCPDGERKDDFSDRVCRTFAVLVDKALADAGMTMADVDAVAVTFAPGLIGAVLVGVNFAKGLAYAAGKPLVPVHHLRGHIAANYLTHQDLKPPFLCLVASGGHSHIVLVEDWCRYKILGRTVDDAAGEAYDKVARTLGLPYPGGPSVAAAARDGNPKAYKLPVPHVDGKYNVSFSGLKTAVINEVHNAEQKGQAVNVADMAASFQERIDQILAKKLLAAAADTNARQVVLAGGVAANGRLRQLVNDGAQKLGAKIFLPELKYCGDNGAMIAAQGYYEFQDGNLADWSLNGLPTLPIDYR